MTEGPKDDGRGEDWRPDLPPPPPPPAWAPPSQPSGGSRLLRLVGRVALIGLIGAGIGWWQARDDARRDDVGSIAAAGELAAEELRVGDCVLEPETEEFLTAGAVPCAEAHDLEIYHAFDLPSGELPGEEGLYAAAERECLPAFERYVGTSFEESVYWLDVITPTEEGWSSGDREILCYLYLDGEQAVGSARGARR